MTKEKQFAQDSGAVPSKDSGKTLRQQAEKAVGMEKNAGPLPPEEIRQTLHELRVHQVELEMQNEELQQKQKELDALRARYFDLYDLAPVGYMIVSKQGLILEANLTVATLLGVARSALSTKPQLTRFILDEDQDIYYLHRKQLFETGEPQMCDLRMVKKDGSIFWAHLTATTALDNDGAPVCRVALTDITTRIQMEEELLNEHNLSSNIMDSSPVGITTVNSMGEITFANARAIAILGISKNDILQTTYNAPSWVISDLDGKPFPYDLLPFNIVMSTEKAVFDVQHAIQWPDGKRILLSINAVPMTDKNGHVSGMVATIEDITERKQAEETLKKSENKYRLLADNIHDVIFVLDMNLKYTYISPSVRILRGYEPEDVLKQQPIEQTLTLSSQDLAMRTFSEIMEMERSEHREINISRTLELEMRRKEGTTVWTEVKLSFIRDEDQRPVGLIGLTRDITDRKQTEKQLKDTLDSLRKAIGTTIQVMIAAIEVRDPYTAGHQIRSAGLARTIATEMGLSQIKIEGIRMAGSIHDIGKLSLPAEILSKPTKLSELEFSLIKEHALHGYEILKNVESPWPLAEIVYQHHERMDGSGYPRNLKGGEILIEARILAVADVVEAMASHRPYRPSLGIDAALAEIEKNRGIFYDEAVVDDCLRLFREKGFKLEVI